MRPREDDHGSFMLAAVHSCCSPALHRFPRNRCRCEQPQIGKVCSISSLAGHSQVMKAKRLEPAG